MLPNSRKKKSRHETACVKSDRICKDVYNQSLKNMFNTGMIIFQSHHHHRHHDQWAKENAMLSFPE